MLLLVQVVSIVFMITLMLVGVWGFIVLNQIFGQFRYKNYLLEKIAQNINMMANKNSSENNTK